VPGVAGRTCDHCEPGYWNYAIHGCKSCGWVKKFSRGVVCDQSSGLCSCLPGVIGPKCDQCPIEGLSLIKKAVLSVANVNMLF